jgi:hypothetical protein
VRSASRLDRAKHQKGKGALKDVRSILAHS